LLKDIKKFLDTKGIAFRQDTNNVQLDCMFCSDTKARLGINTDTGAWNCFNCSRSAKKLSSLEYAWNHKDDIKSDKDNEENKKCNIKKDFHRAHYRKIFKTKEYDSARYVVKHRGLSKEVIKHFQLGSNSKFRNKEGGLYDGGEHLAIPYLVDGKCVNVKYRNLDPDSDRKWQREPGGISSLYNQDVINNLDYDWIVISESEIDTMSLWHLGIKNVVGLTIGAKGFKQDWYDKLKRFKRVYLVLDNDEAGREGSEKIARRLGLGKCYNISLPDDVKDPNDYIQKYDIEHFKKLLKASTKFSVRGARSLRNMMENSIQKKFYAEKEDDKEFFDTPWRKVNGILGPLRPGHLFILCGKPKCFKWDTKVVDPKTGLPTTIEEAVNNKQKSIASYNEKTKQLEIRKITAWTYSGINKCFRLKTASGYLDITADHYVLTPCGMKKLCEIKVGDLIASPRHHPESNSKLFYTAGIVFSEVESIKGIGNQRCYDLEVDGNHNFVANNMVASNSGKSSICLNLMDYWGKKKINVGMYSCEMNEVSIADKFTMMKVLTAKDIESITQTQVHAAMAKLPIDKMNFYFPERKELKGDLESIEGVCVKIEEMVQRYGIKIFIFDNLHFLCRGENEKTLLDTATQQFKLLAEELNILIVMVAHPRKTNSNKQLTTDDMKGSSSLFQDADVVWLMFRKALDGNITPDEVDGNTAGSMSERADISVTGRWTPGGNAFLAFDGKHSSFKDKGYKYMELVKELVKSKKRRQKGL
jgi:replicative DNA helicase